VLLSSCSLWGNEKVKITTAGNVVEVSGGGNKPWKLRYANRDTPPMEIEETHVAPAGQDRAYFSHGPWLRWIDTKRGVVIGRWLLPGRITKITPDGERASIDITDNYFKEKVFSRTFTFASAHPEIPAGTMQNLLAYRIADNEAIRLFMPSMFQPLKPDQARALVPEIQEAIRRDPLSPWFRVVLGKVLLDAGAPGATGTFEQALRLPIDYTELFPISAFLENTHFPQLADEAFERGYRDFLQRGNDPRITSGIIARLVFYPIDWKRIEPARRPLVVERMYLLTPNAEGADLAWTSFLRSARTPAERELWLGRARGARKSGMHILGDIAFPFDVMLLVCIACGLAKPCFIVVSYVRYRPQRRFDKDLAKRMHVPLRKRIPFLNVQYWSFPQRIGFVLIFLVAWFCVGWMKQSFVGLGLVGESPMSFGNLAGPTEQWFFQNRLPSTPERNFLLALSDQQGGDNETAARLYQQASEYAESWNNLGVIRRIQGKDAEASEAFRHAVRMDPTLAEAGFNLGRPASDYWTRVHQQYVPNFPMIAAPPKRLVMNAFLGGPLSQRLRSAWKNALQPWHFDLSSMKVINEPSKANSVIVVLLKLGFCLLILLFLLPRLPVQQSSGIGGNILGVLFPGTSRKWGYVSGLALVAWMYFLVQLVFLRHGSPYLITFIATINLVRAYGAPDVPITSLINPGWLWLYVAPAALFLLNVLVVIPGLWSKRQLGLRGTLDR
jgi:cytochrome c-type biogenesis protein CcmH/NrfG